MAFDTNCGEISTVERRAALVQRLDMVNLIGPTSALATPIRSIQDLTPDVLPMPIVQVPCMVSAHATPARRQLLRRTLDIDRA